MEGKACEINRVPIDEEKQKLVTEDVYTIQVNPKQVSGILSFISKNIPMLEGIEHVKRVKRTIDDDQQVILSVIICQTKMLTKDELDKKFEGTEWQEQEIGISPVPVRAPYTKQQFDEWKQVWPVAFRPPLVVRSEIEPKEYGYVANNLKRIALLRDQSKERGDRAVAVAVVSPKTQNVIAEASDMTNTLGHPLKHAAICCISKVAEIEVGRQRKKQSGDADEGPSGATVPAKRAHTPETPGQGDAQDGFDFETAGYLCEGLDVFASKEPCVMCCMALVHSRIGRLFFLDESSSGGISYYLMHSRKGLNHHFAAYQCNLL
ncbi:tRNA-specific adenosine deaminase subunit tad3 [Dipsacomyces acuminosporus]|nr:tRNA-specific adenosine deaminase subunit tad3 [Dipsacomyces acuminosporus]